MTSETPSSKPKKRVVVLTGAGMSAESGLSTFRDANGLWNNYPVEQVATPEGWEADPQRVTGFYNELRRQMFNAQPNSGHLALARLEQRCEVRIITQNVDNLHERAGSSQVLHLHGELDKLRGCVHEDCLKALDMDHWEHRYGERTPLGDLWRPHIVWFGEAVPMIEPAIEWVSQAEVFVVIGTSLQVYPAAGLLHYVPCGVPVYVIDPNPLTLPNRSELHFWQMKAGEGVKQLVEELA